MPKKLPAQIRNQVDAVEALLAAPAGAPTAQPAADPSPVAEVAPQPPEAPAAPPAETPSAPEAQPRPKDDEQTWEQRYRTLQGMHNQNITDLRRRLDEQERTNREMAEKLRTMQAAPPPPQATSNDDAETFGQDMLDMVSRVLEARVGGVLRAVVERIEQLEVQHQGTSRTVARTAEEAFYIRLKELVNDYEEVNASQAFLAWLADVDPVYGAPRQQALDEAAAALNAVRVAAIFNTYKTSVAPPATPRSARPSLETQVAPAAAAAGAPPKPEGVKYVLVSDVERFYDDVRRGRYRGRETERQAQEQAVNRALAEGRVVDRLPHHAIA